MKEKIEYIKARKGFLKSNKDIQDFNIIFGSFDIIYDNLSAVDALDV
jgi:hypothetical protein